MVIGGVPLRMLQLIITSNPLNTYTGDSILIVTSAGVILSDNGVNGPSSMSGGAPKNINQNIMRVVFNKIALQYLATANYFLLHAQVQEKFHCLLTQLAVQEWPPFTHMTTVGSAQFCYV